MHMASVTRQEAVHGGSACGYGMVEWEVTLYGVFDGHGGQQAACARTMWGMRKSRIFGTIEEALATQFWPWMMSIWQKHGVEPR